MSKVQKWGFSDFFVSRREKLINLLLSEIIFLKSRVKCLSSKEQQDLCNLALEKLNYIMDTIKRSEKEINEQEFDFIINLVHNILKVIISEIEKDLKI